VPNPTAEFPDLRLIVEKFPAAWLVKPAPSPDRNMQVPATQARAFRIATPQKKDQAKMRKKTTPDTRFALFFFNGPRMPKCRARRG
jgi:hypothetical protein